MESKSTSGPWETDGTAVRSSGPAGRQICLCEITVRGRPYEETYDEALANAQLIASAPALLAAAQRLEQAEEFHANCPDCEGEEVPELCGTCFPHFDDARLMRRKAISEALGVTANAVT